MHNITVGCTVRLHNDADNNASAPYTPFIGKLVKVTAIGRAPVVEEYLYDLIKTDCEDMPTAWAKRFEVVQQPNNAVSEFQPDADLSRQFTRDGKKVTWISRVDNTDLFAVMIEGKPNVITYNLDGRPVDSEAQLPQSGGTTKADIVTTRRLKKQYTSVRPLCGGFMASTTDLTYVPYQEDVCVVEIVTDLDTGVVTSSFVFQK